MQNLNYNATDLIVNGTIHIDNLHNLNVFLPDKTEIEKLLVTNSTNLQIVLANFIFTDTLQDNASAILVGSDCDNIALFGLTETINSGIKSKVTFFDIRGSGCTVANNTLYNKFIAIQIEGDCCSVYNNDIHDSYGDSIRVCNSNCSVYSNNIVNAIAYYPYEQFHCDMIQIYPLPSADSNEITNIKIFNNTIQSTDSLVHGILHSDGILTNSKIYDNQVKVASDIGVWVDCSNNCTVTNNKLLANGSIQVGMDKKIPGYVSFGNIVY